MPDAPVRTVGQIVRANVLTPVNAIIGSMFVLIMAAGFPADALFAGVVVSNSVIGIAQELKARRTLRKLAVLSAPQARVVRDGRTRDRWAPARWWPTTILELQPGDQVVVDGEVVAARGLEVDESLLTGESDPVDKAPGRQGDVGVVRQRRARAGTGPPPSGPTPTRPASRRRPASFKLTGSELRRPVST